MKCLTVNNYSVFDMNTIITIYSGNLLLKFFRELNKNNFTAVQALSFEGLERLHSLKLRHNFIKTLQDGAFWKLKNLTIL